MRLDGQEQSRNVEDRRGQRGPGGAAALGGGGILVIIVMLVMKFMGASPEAQQMAVAVAKKAAEAQSSRQQEPAGKGVDDEARVFVSQILGSTEKIWTELFRTQVQGRSYTPAKLVMFDDTVSSGCGNASADMGPFYCPADQKVYLDPHFFTELAERHKAGGDFAQAYVIAHEVAHHVQKLVGFSDRVNAVRQEGDELISNQMSVRLELQADYLAGVWAHHAQTRYNLLEDGDIEEGINAAYRIGDDTLQKEATGYTDPERYTHGTSAQRVKWFKKGLQTGSFKGCEELFKLDFSKL